MPEQIGLFAVASFIVVAVPGPDVMYITARGMDQGRLAGIVSACSAATGGLVLTLCAAVGLSAIVASSAVGFTTVKYLGAAWLIYLGLRRLLQRRSVAPRELRADRVSALQVFGQGFVIAVLNPKTALFFLAFLPQFVNPLHGSIQFQLLELGALFVCIGLCTDTCYAVLSGSVGNWIRGHAGFPGVHRYVTGGTFLALGLTAAISPDSFRASAASATTG